MRALLHSRWQALAAAPRWELLQRAWQSSPRLAALVAALVVTNGLLPTAISLASGALVGALTATVFDGASSAVGQATLLPLICH